jgi:hypothetical protein
MKVATGTIVDGKVLGEGENLAEGSTVTLVLLSRITEPPVCIMNSPQ